MAAFTIRHTTCFTYRQPVSFGVHYAMVRPRDGIDQTVVEADLHISPRPSQIEWSQDTYGNHIAAIHFDGKADHLRVESIVKVEQKLKNFAVPAPEPFTENPWPFAHLLGKRPKLDEFLQPFYENADGAVGAWARRFMTDEQPADLRDLLIKMTHAIRRDFAYAIREAKGIQTPSETLGWRKGTCRDFAVLMIDALRLLGVAARFVSGYVHVPRTPGEAPFAGSTHAWVQAYVPGQGWVDFDPTNGITGNRDLIRVAVVRDPADALPLHGTWFGEAADCLGMDVSVSVTHHENGKEPGPTPRPLAPAWQVQSRAPHFALA